MFEGVSGHFGVTTSYDDHLFSPWPDQFGMYVTHQKQEDFFCNNRAYIFIYIDTHNSNIAHKAR